MLKHCLRHLSDPVLTRRLAEVVVQEGGATARVLAHIAEFDRRRLYRAAGYSSMYKYCLGVLNLSEQAAYKRILAARAARQFPCIFDAVADGRLHLSAVVLLAPHLKPGSAKELLLAATHKTRGTIERLLAERFPRPDIPTTIHVLDESGELSPGIVDCPNPLPLNGPDASGFVVPPVSLMAMPDIPSPPARVAPLAPRRFEWHMTVDQETQDLAEEARELLSHQQPRHELPRIVRDALADYVAKLRKQKHAATNRPQRQKPRMGNNSRYIPNAVKREVWARDGGRCTFVSESGHRCEARTQIEYDHVDPVARGGAATVRNTRLRCRAHNQLEAERVFGAGFMERKRGAADPVVGGPSENPPGPLLLGR